MPSFRRARTKHNRPHLPIGDYRSAGQKAVLEIAVKVHESLVRFVKHRDHHWLMSRKSHGIRTFLRRRLLPRLVNFQAGNSSHAHFQNGKFLNMWDSL